jgi:UDP-N-acetylmuramoylalanine--D-glutamate ligase
MTPVTTMAGRKVAVFGLGGSGLATAEALRAGGAHVSVWDDGETARTKAQTAGFSLRDPLVEGLAGFAALVLSPGVPLTHPTPHPVVKTAQAAGVEIIGDIELFCRERAARAPDAPFVAITGTNGKSTTTALIAHLLRHAGREVAMGGNIGTAILSLPPPSDACVHVVECSTFQIDLTPSLAPSIGVLTNLTPDHLDRHGTMADYAGIKERLVAASGLAVIGQDDDWCRAITKRLHDAGRAVLPLTMQAGSGEGIWLLDDVLHFHGPQGLEHRYSLAGIATLRGVHNAQNAASAIACAEALGVSPALIAEGLKTFPGLAHRMEVLGMIGPVLVVNDSKATNADSAEKALASYPRTIYWIIGGVAKEGGIASLAPYFDRLAHVYLIGKAAPLFKTQLPATVKVTDSGTLDQAFADAVADALADAQGAAATSPVVLLSPACASYDQFPNFEVRGARMRALAEAHKDFVAFSQLAGDHHTIARQEERHGIAH